MNFGEDCDCTGASVGAILGILNPAGIGEKWLAPIGRSLVLSREITGIDAPRTLDEFSELICSLQGRVGLERNPARSFEPRPVRALYTLRRSGKPGEASAPVVFGGQLCRWPAPLENEHEQLVLKFEFRVPADGEYIVMFNTRAQVEVEVDGAPAFRREAGGSMAPSFHRAPWNQSVRLELKAGAHELKAVLQRMPGNVAPDWVLGVGDAASSQWIPDAFCG